MFPILINPISISCCPCSLGNTLFLWIYEIADLSSLYACENVADNYMDDTLIQKQKSFFQYELTFSSHNPCARNSCSFPFFSSSMKGIRWATAFFITRADLITYIRNKHYNLHFMLIVNYQSDCHGQYWHPITRIWF